MSTIVARDVGLRTGRRISHVFLMDVPTYYHVLIVRDAAINIAPMLDDKADICQNTMNLVIALGREMSETKLGKTSRTESASVSVLPVLEWVNPVRSEGGNRCPEELNAPRSISIV